MSNIGIDIEADVSGLEKNLDSAKGKIDDFKNSVEKSAATVSDASKTAGDSIGNAATKAKDALDGLVNGGLTEAPKHMEDLASAANLSRAQLVVFVGVAGAAVTSIAAFSVALLLGNEEARVFERTLIMTGNAAGTTSGQLMDAARKVAEATGATQGATADVMNQLAATGKVTADGMNGAAQAAIDLERAGVQAIKETVKQFAELGKDPVKASEQLNDQYHYLTASVYEQIRTLEEQGRSEDAAALAQKTFADELDDRAKRADATLNILGKSWRFVADEAKGAWDRMLNIGREDTLEQKLAAAQEKLDKMIAARNERSAFGASKAREDRDVGGDNEAEQRALIASLQAKRDADIASAKAQAEANKQTEAAMDWANQGDQYRSKQLRMEQEIAKARQTGVDAGKSEAEIMERVAQIREKYTDKAKAPKAANTDFEQLMNRLSGLDANYDKDLATLYGAYQKGKLGVDEYRQAVEQLIAKQPFAVAAAKDEQRALQEQQKILDATTQAEERAGKAATEFSVKTADRVEAIQRQIELLGKSPDQAAQINAFADIDRQADALLKKLEELRGNVLGKGGDTSGIDDMIAKLPQLADYAKGQASEALGKLKNAQDELNASWEYGADEALRKYLDDVGNVAAQSEKLISGAFKGMEDALTEFVKTGKLDFSSLADSIISDLIRMQIQSSITGPLAAAMKESGGVGGFISSFFQSDSITLSDGSLFSGYHTGGIVGSEPTFSRQVPAVAFANAPRFHTGGIAGDEVPIIAKRGEGVFTPGQMQAMGNSGPTSITVEIKNNGFPQKVTSAQPSFDARGMVLSIITEDIDRNGPMTTSLSNKFNLAQRVY